ncbi:MAG TPA: aspartate aminotransferase family protein [Arenibaculum sp.]|nr:aspartate aminotransferase family protein [Arenibaculum sp.]
MSAFSPDTGHGASTFWKPPARPMRRPRSEAYLARARQSIAGGDSSTMRALPYHPAVVMESGKGCRIRDVDGNEYIDMNMAYGPLLFGHRPDALVEAVVDQVTRKGSQLGFPQELNFIVGEQIRALYPGMELMRFANSGTEAIASAIRLARAHTKRDGIVLFEGHYHGWSEAVFHKYHAPLEKLSDTAGAVALPGTAGMAGSLDKAYMARWNDIASLEACLDRHDGTIAAVIMEPVMGNANVIAPAPAYLEAVRELTRARGVLLIFDEVITGLRVAAGGAQELYGVRPDITVLSKSLAGGYPIAAFGASAELMQLIVDGTLFHGGVYSGNALVLAAAHAQLTMVAGQGQALYDHLEARSAQLAAGVAEIFNRRGIHHVVRNVGGLIGICVTKTPVNALREYRDVAAHGDFEWYKGFQRALFDRGVYFHPNMYEPLFMSAAHGEADIDAVLDRVDDAIPN